MATDFFLNVFSPFTKEVRKLLSTYGYNPHEFPLVYSSKPSDSIPSGPIRHQEAPTLDRPLQFIDLASNRLRNASALASNVAEVLLQDMAGGIL